MAITTYRNTEYTIVAEGSSLAGETGFLLDAYTNVSTEIPANGTVNYSYSVDTEDAASIASDRFVISYASKALSVSDTEIEQIQLYPNPVNNGEFYIQVPQNMDDLEVSVYDALGAQLFSKNSFQVGSKAIINTNFAQKKGLYFVRINSKGNSTIKKLIIN